MNDAVPFDDLSDNVQAFLIECFGEAIRGPVVLFTIGEPAPQYAQPTAATHVLHVRADGSHRYYGKQFEFWG